MVVCTLYGSDFIVDRAGQGCTLLVGNSVDFVEICQNSDTFV